MIVTLLEVAGSLPGNTIIWKYIWNPALYRFSEIHRVRTWRRTVHYVQLPRGWRSSTGSTVGHSGAVFSKLTRNRSPSVLLPVWGENTGGNRFHMKAIESSECVSCRPARSPTNIGQRGATSQRPGGRHTSCRVSSQPERARHTLCLISQGDGIHYPVGHPLLGDGIPFLPASVTDKELVWGPEALRPVNVVSQCSDGTKQSQGWFCLLRGQRLQAHHLVSEWSSGNLGHIAGPGPQDYLGIRRSKL